MSRRSTLSRVLDPFGLLPDPVGAMPRPSQVVDYVTHMVGGRRRRVAAESDYIHVEIRDIDDGELDRFAEIVEPRVAALDGVRWTCVHVPTHRVVVAREPTVDASAVVAVVEEAEAELGLEGRDFAADQVDHPADIDPVIRDLITLGADVVGSSIGWMTQILRPRPAALSLDLSALVSVTEGTNPVRGVVERRIGEPAADVVLGIANALAQGFTSGPLGPMVDLAQRTLDLNMVARRRQTWHEQEDLLFAHRPDKADLAVRVPQRPRPLPDGPIEEYAGRAWLVSLGAFGVVLTSSRRLEQAAAVLQAGVPKSARVGRAAFVAELSRLLSARGAIVYDPARLQHLDRIDCVIVTGELLVDPANAAIAEALARAAHRAGVRLLTDSSEGRIPDGYTPAGASRTLLKLVQHEQRNGSVVALVHDRPSPALAAADFGVGIRATNVAPWGSHVMVTDLVDTLVLIDAIGQARQVARESIGLAMIGSLGGALTALGAATVPGPRIGRRTFPMLAPVNVAAAFSVGNGIRHARIVVAKPRPIRRDPTAWHALDVEEALTRLGTSRAGLTPGEAVARRPVPVRVDPLPVRFVRNLGAELANPLTPVLAIGGALSAAVGSVTDAGLVTGVLGLNSVVGSVQRTRAEQATAALRHVRKKRVRVVREGATLRVPPDEIVQGDIVLLDAGEVVPADCRVVEATGVEVDESSLTGESLPVGKRADPTDSLLLAERRSMLYEGSWVSSGEAIATVVATGDDTEAAMGALLAGEPPTGGVEARLHDLTSRMIPISLLAGAGVAGLGLLRGRPMGETVGAGVSLAVAAVPEGLPFIATVAQLGAARRLASRQVLVRNPRAIEALGRVDVICADKTGTLTEGRLDLRVVSDGVEEARDGDLPEPLRQVLTAAIRATPEGDPDDLAHPTDRAVARGGALHGVRNGVEWNVLEVSPFDPRRGYHAVLGVVDDEHRLFAKGAPEVVLDRCTTWKRGGRTIDLGVAERVEVDDAMARLTRQGLRVLAVADREARVAGPLDDSAVDQLRLLGFVGIADRPRDRASDAVALLRTAGINTIMITGDHPATAVGIGEELGIGGHHVMTGAEIDDLDDAALAERLQKVSVVARVTPVHKVRIVKALQGAGCTVAMTGDGANDAPAIRLADVGIAIGRHSTQAAQAAADLVVVDARIETIVDAVIEGRGMWSSVRDAVSLLTGGNLGEIAFTLAGTTMGGAPPVNTRQLLLVNLLTDAAPAMAIALRPPSDRSPADLLAEGPDVSLGDALDQAIMLRAITTSSAATASYVTGRLTGTLPRARTMALVTLVGTQLGQTITAGGRDPLVLAAGVGSAALLGVIVETPGLSQLFGCRPLGPVGLATATSYAVAGTLSASVVPRLFPEFRLPSLDDMTHALDPTRLLHRSPR